MSYNAEFNAIQLAKHNEYRAIHDAPDMKVDKTAAESAQAWAEGLASTGTFEHSTSDERDGCGENLAMSSDATTMETTGEAVKMWYDEITDPGYDFEDPGFSSGTGHFTQVVWKGSTKLGCGVSQGYVVCRYCDAAGNMMGAFETNVLQGSFEGAALALAAGSKFIALLAIF